MGRYACIIRQMESHGSQRLINQLTDYLVQNANAGLPIVYVLGVKVLEIRYRGEHHAAELVHLGVELVRVLVGKVVGGHVVRQDVLELIWGT